MSEPYWGLVLAVIINSLGGGLIEVIISPIVEALPGDRKAASMSLLHSFYCWGHVLVVVLSTVYFTCIGIDSWRFLPMLWALLPLGNLILFARVPMKSLIDESGKAMPIRAFFKNKLFLLFLLMMVCAGASEQAMSQWASFFAEAGLGVSKTLGDLLGPCSFAILMGLSRLFFGLQRGGFELKRILLLSSSICIVSYLITVFSPWPLFALIGCGICGLSVGIMWPGVFSLSSRIFPLGGTAMFAILALGGDLGCASGPGIVGVIMNSTTLNTGLLTAIIFPIILTIGIGLLYREERHT
jgi:fucose permease